MMGSNPEAVEQAFSNALGTVAQARLGEGAAELDKTMFLRLTAVQKDRQRLQTLLSGSPEGKE